MKAEQAYERDAYDEARCYYQQAFNQAMHHNYPDLAVNLLVDLSALDHYDGEYTVATNRCLQGRSILNQFNSRIDSTYFKVFSSLGEYYRQREYVDSSAYYFEKADSLLSSNPGLKTTLTEYVIYHFSNQSMLQELIGRFTLSESLAQQALSLARQWGHSDDIAIVSTVVAGQYERLGKFKEAMHLRLEGLARYTSVNRQKARMYSGIGSNALRQGQIHLALKFLHRAEAMYKKWQHSDSNQNDYKHVIAVYSFIGRSYLALGRNYKAKQYVDRAITSYQKKYGQRGRLLADCWLMKGQIHARLKQYDRALTAYRIALVSISSTTLRFDKAGNSLPDYILDEKKAVEILMAQGKLHRHLLHWELALTAFQRAIQVFQQARRQLYLLEDKLYLAETVHSLYQFALESAYHVYYTKRTQYAFDQAFTLSEQGHAIALQDLIAESVLRPKYIPEREIRLEQRLRQQLAANHIQLLDNWSMSKRTQMLNLERNLRTQHNRILDHWEKKYPAYHQARFLYKPVTTHQVQVLLPKSAAYLSFGYSHGQLHLFALTQERTVWKTIPVDSSLLARSIRAFHDSLAIHPGTRRYQGSFLSIQIYNWFIAPLLPVISGKEEWIVNAGILDGIPIEAVETGKKVNDFLANSYVIRYIYSAALLSSTAEKPADESPVILAIAPFTHAIPAHLEKRFHYWPLSETADEINGIDARRRLIDEEATRPAFLALHKAYSIWYFSTHAFLHETEYAQSYLALYPQDTTRSHRFYADEISQMNLRHLGLVILSICDAGNGITYSSEGIMSLARAFSYAGCPSTINTLWNAHERSSVVLMKRFLFYLQRGLSPALSLKRAREDFFNSDDGAAYNHPYFWANFAVVGANVPLYSRSPFPTGSLTAITLELVLSVLLVSLLLAIYHQLRRKSWT